MLRTGLRLQRDERIMFTVHRHWIAFAVRAVVPVLLGAGVFFFWASRAFSTDPLTPQPSLFDGTNLVLMLIMAALGALVAYVWFDWRNDQLLITNKRVVHEERTLALSYRYQTITLDRVQNVNVQQNGIQKLLNYGRVTIQAAAPSRPLIFNPSERPRALQAYLLGEIKREKREQDAKLRDDVVQRRIDPRSLPPDPWPEPSVAFMGPPDWWHTMFPFAPIVDNNTITWHRHWSVLINQIAVPLLALVVWIVGLVAVQQIGLLGGVVTSVFAVLLIAIVGYLVWQYDDWRNDIYVLEPARLIDIERLPLGLFENRREAPLSAIQNVDIESPSLWARTLGYGNVEIQTAGAAGNFVFDSVGDPRDVQRVVFAYQERFRKQGREREMNANLDLVELYLQRRGNQSGP